MDSLLENADNMLKYALLFIPLPLLDASGVQISPYSEESPEGQTSHDAALCSQAT